MAELPQAEVALHFPGAYLDDRQPFLAPRQIWHLGQLGEYEGDIDVERVVLNDDDDPTVTQLTLIGINSTLPEASLQNGYREPALDEYGEGLIHEPGSLVFRRELSDGRSYYHVQSAASLCLAPFFGKDGSYWGWGSGVYLRLAAPKYE